MLAHRTRQYQGLHVAAHQGQIMGAHGMVHALNVLFDDGAFIQVGGNVMGRAAYDLPATRTSLVVRTGALDPGQAAVMNIYGIARSRPSTCGGQLLPISP